MIEVCLELKLNSFLINSTGDAGGLPVQLSARMLRFSCDRILSARQLTDDTPSVDFDFLGTANTREDKLESDREFDNLLIKYLSSHRKFDISKIIVAFGETGYHEGSKESSSKIGRLVVEELSDKSSLDVGLVIKQSEFDVVWELTTKQNIRELTGKFVCFKPKNADHGADSEAKYTAGIFSSSLQMMPVA